MKIYENDLFEVKLFEFCDPILNETVLGYGVFNKRTGAREAESRREFTAVVLADGFQDQHLNPERYVEPAKHETFTAPPGGGVAH